MCLFHIRFSYFLLLGKAVFAFGNLFDAQVLVNDGISATDGLVLVFFIQEGDFAVGLLNHG